MTPRALKPREPNPSPNRGFTFNILLQPDAAAVIAFLEQTDPPVSLVEKCLSLLTEQGHPYQAPLQEWVATRRSLLNLTFGVTRPYTIQDWKSSIARSFGRVPMALYYERWQNNQRFYATMEPTRIIVTFEEG